MVAWSAAMMAGMKAKLTEQLLVVVKVVKMGMMLAILSVANLAEK